MRISDWSSDVCSSDLLFLAARKPFVDGPIQELLAHADRLHLAFYQLDEIHGVEFGQALMAPHRVDGRLEEIRIGDARNFNGILKGQKQARTGALFYISEERRVGNRRGNTCKYR